MKQCCQQFKCLDGSPLYKILLIKPVQYLDVRLGTMSLNDSDKPVEHYECP